MAGDSASAAHPPAISDGFLRDAEAALDVFRRGGYSCRGPRGRLHPSARIKRLVFSFDEHVYRAARPYWMVRDDDHAYDDDRVCGLALAHPAASQLEQLLLHCRSYDFRYRPRLESLRCAATLRVLEIKGCSLDPPTLAPSTALALPRLTNLSLHDCIITKGYLQVLLQAATALTNLELVHVRHKTTTTEKNADPANSTVCLRLRCPNVAAFVLDTSYCRWNEETEALDKGSIELDMPSLRSFRYKGRPPVMMSLTSPPPALEQTDLKFGFNKCEHVSRILTSFSTTRSLTLSMKCIEDIVAAGEEDGKVIFPTFPNLRLLVLDATYKHRNNDTGLAMARLLGSCPVMSELRLNLNTMWEERHINEKDPPGWDFRVSLDRFNRLLSMDPEQGDNNIGVSSSEISELTALSGCTLTCLRKVTLRCEANELNCFPVQLAKFLAENAMDLEEMHVHDGSQFWTHHLHNNVARWRADSFRKKNLPDTGHLQVYCMGFRSSSKVEDL